MLLHPLGLLALLGVPVVVAIHFFRRRFRPREVSALFLWRDEDDVALAGRKRERLRAGASFWLEVLAAALLGLVFAGPRACGAGEAEHLVVVLDASASMGAKVEGRTLAERAVEMVRERIATLPSDTRVTVVESGPRPHLSVGPAAFAAEARDALTDYEPTAARHDLAPTVALAQQLSAGGRVLVVTDHYAPESFPDEVELLSIGRRTPNVAITHATRTRAQAGDGTERVLLTLGAFADEEEARTLVLLDEAGREIERRGLRLAPDERRHLTLDLPAGTGPVFARLTPDALPLDDLVALAPVPPRTLGLASTCDEVTARRLGLSRPEGASGIDRWLAVVPDSMAAPDQILAHLHVGPAPTAGPTTWSLVLPPLGPGRDDLVGPFLAERHHPVLDGLTLDGLVWSIDPALRLVGTPLVSAGDTPILTEERDGDRVRWWMNIDPARSNLPRSPDWPILLANLAELRRRELPGPVRTNVAVGDSLVFRGEGEARYTVRAEDGSFTREIPARDTLVVEDLEHPGLYALEREGRELCRFGVAFADPAESDLRTMRGGHNARALALARVHTGVNPLQSTLLATVLLMVLADWWVLERARRRLRFDPDTATETGN